MGMLIIISFFDWVIVKSSEIDANYHPIASN